MDTNSEAKFNREPTPDPARLRAVRKTDPAETTPVQCRKIVAREQTVIGKILEINSGPVTSCILKITAGTDFAELTGLKRITVFQVAATKVEGVILSEHATVMVRGLLFTDRDTLKMVAKRITQP